MKYHPDTALIVTDMQNDFMPGGPLAVPGAHELVPLINGLMPHYQCVVLLQDWHPEDHGSFAAVHGIEPGGRIDLHGIDQIVWPTHSVAGSRGADFHPNLQIQRAHAVIRKGTDPKVDSYSGFFDNAQQRCTGLAGYLRELEVTRITIVGVATDYCVRATALDGIELGFRTTVVADACRGVNLEPGDSEAALEHVRAAGGQVVHLEDAEALSV